jgi:hypothetical protein
MSVGFINAARSHSATGSQSEASFTWDHTPSSTAKSVHVEVFTNANADYITSVTCNGKAMTQKAEASGSTAEAGRTTLFEFVGPPAGTLTFVVTRTNNATMMSAISMAFSAAAGFFPAYLADSLLTDTTVAAYAERAVDRHQLAARGGD